MLGSATYALIIVPVCTYQWHGRGASLNSFYVVLKRERGGNRIGGK